MGSYLVHRVLQSSVVVIGASALIFVLVRLTGDPVALLVPPDATAADITEMRHMLGLDEPIWVQYARFVSRAIQGDFGDSFRNHQPAMSLVFDRVPATLALAGTAFFVALALAIPIGILSATHRDSVIDAGGRVLALVGQAVPSFWLGIMLILVFSVRLGWLPAFGGGTLDRLVLPSIALGAYSAAITTRLLRSSLLEVLTAGYIQTARAKGLSGAAVVTRHALRNAAIPVVTVLGLQAGHLLAGSIIIEWVFAYPGVGRLVLDAVRFRDYAIVQAFVLLLALVVAVINLLVDMMYAALDPRIRYR